MSGIMCAFAYTVHLAAGDGAVTLTELSRQLRVQLLFDSEQVSGHLTHAVDGEFTLDEALHIALSGSNLVWDRVDHHTFYVIPARKPDGDPSPSQASAR